MSDIGKLTECPKCGLEAKTLLHPFCTHEVCPVREAYRPAPAAPKSAAQRLDEVAPVDRFKTDSDHWVVSWDDYDSLLCLARSFAWELDALRPQHSSKDSTEA